MSNLLYWFPQGHMGHVWDSIWHVAQTTKYNKMLFYCTVVIVRDTNTVS